MAHILTESEAVGALRAVSADEVLNLELLLSAVDDGLKTETGHDWAADTTIDPTAKLAASLLLVCLYDGTEVPVFYTQKVTQLEAKVLNAEVE